LPKELYIIRHAKSSWLDEGDLLDIDRPLDVRGVKDAYGMGIFLKEKKVIFDKVYASNGIRALHTATIMCKEMGVSLKKITINKKLYHPLKQEILEVIQACDDKCEVIAIFSHNPGLADFAFETHHEITDLATTGVVHCKVNVGSWSKLDFKKLEFISYFKPQRK
jgi:phosphohistidine phosphatase